MQDQPVALIVNSNQRQIEQLRSVLADESLDVLVSSNFQAALERVERIPIDTLITPLHTGLLDGLKVLEIARLANPDVGAVFLTAHLNRAYLAQESSRKELLTHEHSHLLATPVNPIYLRNLLRKILATRRLLIENRELKLRIDGHTDKYNLVGNSVSIQNARRLVSQISTSRAPILITGNRGTGRQTVARSIHHRSLRAGQFVIFNCDLVDHLFTSSDLFTVQEGWQKSSSSLPTNNHHSRYQSADGGTLFLSEIGRLSLSNQSILLNCLNQQDQTIKTKTSDNANFAQKLDVRLVCSNESDLADLVAEGKFMADLYNRLRTIQIQMIRLRNRKDDIPLLANFFLEEFCAAYNKPVKSLSTLALNALMTHNWPGNVRELRNTIEGMVAISETEHLNVEAVPQSILKQIKMKSLKVEQNHSNMKPEKGKQINVHVGMTMANIEKAAIKSTLESVNNNRLRAAEMLGVSRRTIFRKIREYGL